MCPESRLPRGSKIRALLDWFPEILRLSTPYVHACVPVAELRSGRPALPLQHSFRIAGNVQMSSRFLLLLERQQIHSPGQADIRIRLLIDKSTIWIAVGTERLAENCVDT